MKSYRSNVTEFSISFGELKDTKLTQIIKFREQRSRWNVDRQNMTPSLTDNRDNFVTGAAQLAKF